MQDNAYHRGLLVKSSSATSTCLARNRNSTKSVMSNFKESSFLLKIVVVLQMIKDSNQMDSNEGSYWYVKVDNCCGRS